MPELPEVETIVRELNRKVAGKKLSRFLIFDPAPFASGASRKISVRAAKGAGQVRIQSPRFSFPTRVLSVTRHGKHIVFNLDCKKHCIIHLRMTGELIYEKKPPTKPRPKNERAALYFSDRSVLHFFDTRRFGTIKWPTHGNLPHLGAEPLSKEFNEVFLKNILERSSQKIKSFLLDQKKIAGIGNIYADESLWTAKINPKRKADSLSVAETKKLVSAIKNILRKAIKMGGSTIRDYRRTGGESGYYQHSRRVYDREGLPCVRCRAKIKRIKIGGRSSYFCKECQPLSK